MGSVSVEKIAKKLIRQKKLGQSTILFLGAGVSVSAGIPTTPGIVEYIKSRERLNSIISAESDDYFDIMADLDPAERRRILSNFIEKSHINESHLIVALLMKLGFVDCIITTNFDSLIKRSLSLINLDYPAIDITNNVSLSGYKIPFPVVFYLHGEYRNVLQLNTKEELNSKRPKIKSVIEKINSGRTWLICGYSGNDIIFDELAKVERFDEGLYWIGYQNEPPSKKVDEGLFLDSINNAHFIAGFDSDTFFKKLIDEIEKQQSISLAEILRSLRTSLKGQQKLEQISPIHPIKTNLITKKCDEWISEKIVQNLSASTKSTKQNKRIWESFLKKLPSFFEPQKDNKISKFILEGNYSEAILIADLKIEKYPNSVINYYLKGLALGKKAENEEELSEAYSIYKKMNQQFEIARLKNLDEQKFISEIDYIDQVKRSLWQKEHNKAVKIASDEKEKKKYANPYLRSFAHLKNALVIQPYQALTWEVQATLNNMRGNYGKAAESQKKYLELQPNADLKAHRLLAQYYLLNEEPEKAVQVLEAARKEFPQNVGIVETLADAYSQMGEADKAIGIVEELVEQDSSNAQYHLSLGTRLYQSAMNVQSSYDENLDQIFELRQEMRSAQGDEASEIEAKIEDLQQKNNELRTEIEGLTDRAITELNKTIENRPNESVAYNTLGIIYQNKAAVIFDKRNMTTDNKKAAALDKEAKEQLPNAMENYEKAAEIDPENKKYWRSLFQVYTALGMDEKAKNAEQRASII